MFHDLVIKQLWLAELLLLQHVVIEGVSIMCLGEPRNQISNLTFFVKEKRLYENDIDVVTLVMYYILLICYVYIYINK